MMVTNACRLVAVAAMVWLAAAATPAGAADAPGALQALCDRCATVTSVRSARRTGEATALGMLGGAVLGGAVGHRLGKGDGQTLATVGGAVAGGLAGREIERRARRYTVWITTVTLKNGRPRSFEARSNPGLRAGDIVVVEDATLRRYMPQPAAR